MSMANRMAGEVSIRLDRTRTLKFDFNALAEFRQKTGSSVELLFVRLANSKPASEMAAVEHALTLLSELELRALLWAALLHQEPQITIEEAGRLMDQADGESQTEKANYIFLKIFEAWAATKPAQVKKNLLRTVQTIQDRQKASAQIPENGTGTHSDERPSAILESPLEISGG